METEQREKESSHIYIGNPNKRVFWKQIFKELIACDKNDLIFVWINLINILRADFAVFVTMFRS